LTANPFDSKDKFHMEIRMIPAKRVTVLLAALVLWPVSVRAAGQLMVHPTRIIFEGRVRTAQIDVINNGTEPATYRISLVRKRMTETGEFVTVETPQPGENFADEMIRFSPRQVTLPPGGAQVVRLQLRKPAALAVGEYRSHLLFQALPSAGPLHPREEQRKEGLEIELTAILSISIPVIIREGETTARVNLANVAVKPPAATGDLPVLAFELRREGNRSVYGDVIAYFAPRGGRELVVGRASGVAVYVPNSVRRAKVPLQLPPTQRLANGQLRVAFVERPESGGRVLADATVDLP
jgi:fimbrial chaperone protein